MNIMLCKCREQNKLLFRLRTGGGEVSLKKKYLSLVVNCFCGELMGQIVEACTNKVMRLDKEPSMSWAILFHLAGTQDVG